MVVVVRRMASLYRRPGGLAYRSAFTSACMAEAWLTNVAVGVVFASATVFRVLFEMASSLSVVVVGLVASRRDSRVDFQRQPDKKLRARNKLNLV